jgi:hypothetical protein
VLALEATALGYKAVMSSSKESSKAVMSSSKESSKVKTPATTAYGS